MEFSPSNHVVRLCLQGMEQEGEGKSDAATELFVQAWSEATNDFEKYLAAHFVSRHQENVAGRLRWLETALQFALKVNDPSVTSALPSLYSNIARCYEETGDHRNAEENHASAIASAAKVPDSGPFFHGTRAELQRGDLLSAGFNSNYSSEVIMNHVYFTALVHGAGLAAALAKGDGRERVYIVEPTGRFENDPNVTDKKFPGNPTRSYRTEAPLRIVGEVTDWVRQTPEELAKWRERLARSKGKIIN
jgi:hypothetical protein